MAGLEMRYFILSPASGDKTHAAASRAAIRAYAAIITFSNAQLASDLLHWMDSLEIDHEGADIRQPRPAEGDHPAMYGDGIKPAPKLFAEPAQSQFEAVRAETVQQRKPDGRIANVYQHPDPKGQPHPDPLGRSPNLLLDGPPEGWFIERDEKENPTGYLIRTEDGLRKWHTDKVFHEYLK